jgi:zinc protease
METEQRSFSGGSMKKKLFLLIALFVCASMTAVGGEAKKEFKIPYEQYQLANGLDVILHVDKSDPLATVYVCYHVGSNREKKGKTGFAHLFEHIMFQESQHIPQDQFFKKIQGAGGTLNGSTNNDRTNYFETVPKNALEMALWMEADRMGFLLSKLTQAAFENQQNVVQNEKRQGDNQPYAQDEYVLGKLMYPENHPYNWDVIGEMEDLANASLQDVIDFYKEFYGPRNATLVVAGDIDVKRTKGWIEKYYGEIAAYNQAKAMPKMRVTLGASKRAYIEDKLANAPDLTIAFPTVEKYSQDVYALKYLGQLLSEGEKSPLYKVIVEENKLAPAVSATSRNMELAGTFAINVRAFPGENLGGVEAAIKEGLVRFEKDGFADKDLERLKNSVEVGFYNSIASVLGKAMRLAEYNEYAGSTDFMNTDLNNYLQVTKEDVWRVYNQYVKGKNSVLLSIVPLGKADLAAPDSSLYPLQEEALDKQGVRKTDAMPIKVDLIPTKFDRSKEPAKGPDPLVHPPQIWSAKTANGIRIYGVRHSELPLIQFAVILKGGMLLDGIDKIGTAFLTAKMLNEGTKTKTAIELREAAQDLGATINVNAGPESITLTGTCLADKLNETIALAREMLLEPRWDEKEFPLVKSQTSENLKRMEAMPAAIASNVFSKLLYGKDCILASIPMGSVKSIASINMDDLKNYHEKNFSSAVAKIMVIGDITREKALAGFNVFKDWPAKEVKMPEMKITATAKPGVYFVDVPKAQQSQFRVGHLAAAYTDPDYYKTVVMNHRLGGDFNGILNMILREEKGFTYGARSSFSAFSYPGFFAAVTSVQTNATFATAQIIRMELAKYREGISAGDLAMVRSTLLKGNALKFETLNALSQMLTPVVIYDLPFTYIKDNEAIVQKMTPGEHKRLAQKYLQPEKMIYLIVGDKATQFDKLQELGLGAPVLLDRDANPVSN